MAPSYKFSLRAVFTEESRRSPPARVRRGARTARRARQRVRTASPARHRSPARRPGGGTRPDRRRLAPTPFPPPRWPAAQGRKTALPARELGRRAARSSTFVSGLLKSCATPSARIPRLSSFCACRSCCSLSLRSVTSVHNVSTPAEYLD